MKVLLGSTSRALLFLAVLACIVTFGATSAMAQSPSNVQRTVYQGETHTGICCSNWDATVRITEPDKIAPIVVTFSADYRANVPFFAALRLNGGPCVFYGPTYLPAFSPADESYASRTFQWVILPGDYKLVKGPNTIQVCGGGTVGETDTITLGFNTLTAHLQK